MKGEGFLPIEKLATSESGVVLVSPGQFTACLAVAGGEMIGSPVNHSELRHYSFLDALNVSGSPVNALFNSDPALLKNDSSGRIVPRFDLDEKALVSPNGIHPPVLFTLQYMMKYYEQLNPTKTMRLSVHALPADVRANNFLLRKGTIEAITETVSQLEMMKQRGSQMNVLEESTWSRLAELLNKKRLTHQAFYGEIDEKLQPDKPTDKISQFMRKIDPADLLNPPTQWE